MFKKISKFTVLSLLSSNALAAGYMTDLHNPQATITSFFTHGSGGVTLVISGMLDNPDGCNDPNTVHLKGDLAGHEKMVSAALTAFVAGKKVGLYTAGCEIIPFWSGTNTRPIITNLWIK